MCFNPTPPMLRERFDDAIRGDAHGRSFPAPFPIDVQPSACRCNYCRSTYVGVGNCPNCGANDFEQTFQVTPSFQTAMLFNAGLMTLDESRLRMGIPRPILPLSQCSEHVTR